MLRPAQTFQLILDDGTYPDRFPYMCKALDYAFFDQAAITRTEWRNAKEELKYYMDTISKNKATLYSALVDAGLAEGCPTGNPTVAEMLAYTKRRTATLVGIYSNWANRPKKIIQIRGV